MAGRRHPKGPFRWFLEMLGFFALLVFLEGAQENLEGPDGGESDSGGGFLCSSTAIFRHRLTDPRTGDTG